MTLFDLFEDEPIPPYVPQTYTCVLRWRLGWLTSKWSHGPRAFFRDWPSALSAVLHPNNEPIRLRVR